MNRLIIRLAISYHTPILLVLTINWTHEFPTVYDIRLHVNFVVGSITCSIAC